MVKEKMKKKTVLVVDDSLFMRKVLRDVLTKGGYSVIGEADSAEEAVKLYKKLKPDIVTMDIILPGKTGIDALKEIKNIDKNAKIVMITALGQQLMVVEAIRAGAKDYITKPFEVEKIIEALKRL